MIPTEVSLLRPIVGNAMQMSYVVPDLEAALAFWTGSLGVGPFVVIEDAASDRIVTWRGRQTRVTMTLAFAYVGEVQIELVGASCPDPTPWTDFLDSGRQGLHHLGFWPQDYARACAQLERMGFTPDCRIETESGELSALYFSGPPHLGVMVELAPNSPARVAYFKGIKAISEGWDGTRPIRRYATRAAYLASVDARS